MDIRSCFDLKTIVVYIFIIMYLLLIWWVPPVKSLSTESSLPLSWIAHVDIINKGRENVLVATKVTTEVTIIAGFLPLTFLCFLPRCGGLYSGCFFRRKDITYFGQGPEQWLACHCKLYYYSVYLDWIASVLRAKIFNPKFFYFFISSFNQLDLLSTMIYVYILYFSTISI